MAQLDEFMNELNRRIRISLTHDKSTWDKEGVNRFLAELSINKKIESICKDRSITLDGKLLFHPYKLRESFECLLNKKNYFPIQKLLIVVDQIIKNQTSNELNLNDHSAIDQNHNRNQFHSKQPYRALKNDGIDIPTVDNVRFRSVTEQMKEIDSIRPVWWLNSLKIVNILSSAGQQNVSDVCKEFGVDGFSLIYIIPDPMKLQDIKSYFTQAEVQIFQYLSLLFNAQLLRQTYSMKLALKQQNSIDDRQSIAYSRQVSEGTLSMPGSQIQQSQIFFPDEKQNSKLFYYGHSKKRSTFTTIKESVQQLKKKAKHVPFDVLNLDPIMFIKIRQVPYPFLNDTQDGRKPSESKVFYLSGLTIGHREQNDYSFPEQTYISKLHARIFFKDSNFYLKDMGSRNGTFLRVHPGHPYQIPDQKVHEFIAQLSNTCEFTFKTIWKKSDHGCFRIKFTKPIQFERQVQVTIKNQKAFKIGRSSKNSLSIDEESLSPKHAEIKYRNNRFYLQDCNTRTGTWVRLSARSDKSKKFRLEKGMQFRIPWKFVFQVEDISSTGPEDQTDTVTNDDIEPVNNFQFQNLINQLRPQL